MRSIEIPRPIDGVEVPGCGKVRRRGSKIQILSYYFVFRAVRVNEIVFCCLLGVCRVQFGVGLSESATDPDRS